MRAGAIAGKECNRSSSGARAGGRLIRPRGVEGQVAYPLMAAHELTEARSMRSRIGEQPRSSQSRQLTTRTGEAPSSRSVVSDTVVISVCPASLSDSAQRSRTASRTATQSPVAVELRAGVRGDHAQRARLVTDQGVTSCVECAVTRRSEVDSCAVGRIVRGGAATRRGVAALITACGAILAAVIESPEVGSSKQTREEQHGDGKRGAPASRRRINLLTDSSALLPPLHPHQQRAARCTRRSRWPAPSPSAGVGAVVEGRRR